MLRIKNQYRRRWASRPARQADSIRDVIHTGAISDVRMGANTIAVVAALGNWNLFTFFTAGNDAMLTTTIHENHLAIGFAYSIYHPHTKSQHLRAYGQPPA